MDNLSEDLDGMGYDMSHIMSQAPQIFGGFNTDGSPVTAGLSDSMFAENQDPGSVDENEAKRRRIARVRSRGVEYPSLLISSAGLRHVPKEEDQM